MIMQEWLIGVQFVIATPTRHDAFHNGDEFTYDMGPVVTIPVTTNGGLLTKAGFESKLDPTRRSNRHWLFMRACKTINDSAMLSRQYPKGKFLPVGYTKIVELKNGEKR